MAKNNSWQSALLLLLFNNTAAANIGNTAGLQPAGVAGSLYVSLHTADPTTSGNQTSNEVGYQNYARVAVARSSAGWTISGSSPTQAANTAVVTFPQAGTSGACTALYMGIGTSLSGAGELIYSGALTSSLAISNNITPSFAIGALIVNES